MQTALASVKEYLDALPDDRRKVLNRLRQVIRKNLPPGFEETISYGMIGYVVPHRLYPAGYHCDPKLPLPFASIASQKNFVALYHMALYADANLLQWFTDAYRKQLSSKPDMGKSCVRFKKPDCIPYDLIGELMRKITVDEWIALYEGSLRKTKRN
ncbi:MAG: hypothetical protein KatS3mg031_1003 [Chitinophagales bacterium]|nr:MAG: hypothetical protein KatS3mg031_1003 [Chitinophagales bacterium]